MKNTARLINNSYYLISLRIHGLNKVNFNEFLIDKNDLEKLREFNDKLCYRLEKYLFDYPFNIQHTIQEPDFIKSQEMVEDLSTLFADRKSKDLLRHLYEQLFVAIVLVEDNKLLWEKLSVNPDRNLKWYLYTINLLYENFQGVVLKNQDDFSEILNSTRYENLSITEVKMKNLPKLETEKIMLKNKN